METEDRIATQSISLLFEASKRIRIPAYQRAYSWEKKQTLQFLEDLIEQIDKKYYLGQFLFEVDDNNLYIIDGQQRITTTIIFISVIVKLLIGKMVSVDHLTEKYLGDKFKTIEADQNIFKKIVAKHQIVAYEEAETLSQKRLIGAVALFEEKLAQYESDVLLKILKTLEDSIVYAIFVSSKVEATQIFEHQNDRGKELTRFEVIKAYLMHQVYLNHESEEVAISDIGEIQKLVATTYRYIENVEGYFTENELLDNFCYLYFGINGNIGEVKDLLRKKSDKLKWILEFFEGFNEVANSAKLLVAKRNDDGIMNLFLVGNEVDWKVVLLAIFLKNEQSSKFSRKIFKLLEILCFKLKLGDFRTDYLAGWTRKYFSENSYDLTKLHADIYDATKNGFKWYWNNDGNFQNIFTRYFQKDRSHYDPNKIVFVLWQYENKLRSDHKSGILLDLELFREYTVEHICPQTPRGKEYTKKFSEKYLHTVGNLALLTKSQNSKFSNRSFEEKLDLFQDTALTSYKEIRDCPNWGEPEIDKRNQNICDFAIAYFELPT